MRMGGHSGFERITVYGLCLMMLCLTWPVPVRSNPLLLLAVRPAIARMIATRAAIPAANDAVRLTLVHATTKPLSEKITQQALLSSASRHLSRSGKVTWAGLGVSAGIMTIDEVMKNFDKEKISAVTSENLLPEAERDIFRPTVTNPVFIYPGDISVTKPASHVNSFYGSSVGREVPSQAKFYVCSGFKMDSDYQCFYGANEESVAFDYMRHELLKSGKTVTSVEVVSKAGGGMYPYPDGSLGLTDRLSVIVKATVAGEEYVCKEPEGEPCGYVRKDYDENENITVHINDNFAVPVSLNNLAMTGQSSSQSAGMITGDLDSAYKRLQENPPLLDNALLVRLINHFMLQTASSPDYKGIAFSSANPFTEAELSHALKALNVSPTQLEFFSPVVDPMTNQADINLLKNDHNPVQAFPAGSSGQPVDMTHPGTAAPALENPPDGKQILAPLLTLFPFIKNFSLPVRNASCPVAEFDVFEKHYVMNTHCELLEKSRGLLALFAGIIWAFLSLRLILSA